MVKAPVAGRVKTRLGGDIGMVPAAWWFRHQTARLLRRLDDPRWDIVLAVSPDNATAARFWPAHLPRVPQRAGDLGARMARLLRLPHPGPVCLIGADIPAIEPPHIARAFAALGHNDFVFGPARDGGFWLTGVRHPSHAPAGLFANVRWSTRHALADSLATLGQRSHALTDMLSDVDHAADL
ncbi:TIGR04282 family arsenosugar biosynthesis glycosyltransferase [Aquicoccus sp. G2-2]|uniref:TIGR04282 family arsenosugar biosynthesis glycosyltransferase n=1 Tax=Aquicoccus sp. G2-2 TaxID=3092120 RepID=UPI002ADFCB79|nr:TIGR04282 family arsenosugar biosynthesis glycosyltransferase [Aquicoccus sp. G2-2]MEA1115180.1 TIGR04282 family arsenosugar biosynthesis glycosyltransferase [Aquicoccus sp. G2-2]